MSLPHASRVSRADLLRSLINAGYDSLATMAELSGYATPEKRKLEFTLPSLPPSSGGGIGLPKPPPIKSPASPFHYYRVVGRKKSALLPDTGSEGVSLPDWYNTIPDLDVDSIRPAAVLPPTKEPLVPWARLWPVVQSLLSGAKRSRQPDMPRLVRMLANAEMPVQIPRQTRQQWLASVQLLVDRPTRTALFDDDYNLLLGQLQQLRGTTGLQVQQVIRHPGGVVRIRQAERYHTRPWHLPETGSAILILSDLGLLDRNGRDLSAWLKFGKRLRTAGFRPVVLLPLPARYLIPEVIALFDCICWTRQGDLRPVRWAALPDPRDGQSTPPLDKDMQTTAPDLLAWLSPAVRVEPALLRAVCHRLPAVPYDVGAEVAAWLHEDVEASSIGLHYKPAAIEKYRQRFRVLAEKDPSLAKTVVHLLRGHHRHVFPTQLHEEMLVLADLLGDQLEAQYQPEVEAASIHGKQLLKALNEKQAGTQGLAAFVRHHLERQHKTMWQGQYNSHLPALWGVMARDYLPPMSGSLPDYIASSPNASRLVLAFLDQTAQVARDYVLFQQGMKELKASSRNRYEQGQQGFREGSPLATFTVTAQYGLKQVPQESGKLDTLLLPLNDDVQDCRLQEGEQQHLHIAGEELTIERFSTPDWVKSIGRDEDSLIVTTGDQDRFSLWYWHPPEWQPDNGMFPGFWHYLPPNTPTLTPSWAKNSGRDQYGLYADLNIAGITQRFRWIQPGSFLMGSPPEEEGRYDNETQHRVILTQGYWLADTACTNDLWRAINERPRIKATMDMNAPATHISWHEITQSLQQFNRQQSELALRLPTEAEWEYACRAGTTTAFHFGGKDDLSLEKVNYSGEWDGYNSKGKTKPVKSYSPNQWGLYEMHGNVLEWCQDWFGDYPVGSVVDPQGVASGTYRVLRGGSWLYDGRDCRSAHRIHGVPADRNLHYGFRLSLGLELQSGQSGAGQQPVGTHAAVARGAQAGDGLRAVGEVQKPDKTTRKNPKGLLDRAKDLFKK
jgi:formylglycine-generating enzyme required for sulfatase activity/rRNA maturation protein Nop10